MKFALTKYGLREWLLATLFVAAGIAVSIYYSDRAHWWWSLLVIVPLSLVWLWVLWFFRDPGRTPPGGQNLLVSPADGRVSDITPIGAESPLGEPGLKIGIFMNVFNVHVNRSPADASVDSVEHVPGLFLDVRNPLASERNESATIFLAARLGSQIYPLVVRQIAGLIARRIVTDLKPDQPLVRGQRIGMIKFGSRLELLVPDTLRPKVLVKLGDHVRAGESVLVEVAPGVSHE